VGDMLKKGRVRPSKGSSVVAMIIGLVFIMIGITTVIPVSGPFGVFWTLIAGAITIGHGLNVFTSKGFSQYEVEVEHEGKKTQKNNDFDSKLRKLKKLKDDGIISEVVYEIKKNEIIQEKW
jgi:hypothetical protein